MRIRRALILMSLWNVLLSGDTVVAQENALNQSRLLLSKIRGGDYTHAGDKEAIDIVLKKVLSLDPQVLNKPTLDVGCGFGGTADYLQKQGFNNIQGIDTDETAISYAQSKYPNLSFHKLNAIDIHKAYPDDSFGFIYLFNVAYAIQDKEALLKSLHKAMKPQGILVLFDYACEDKKSHKIKDLANKPMYPISLDKIHSQLDNTGWEIIEMVDMTENYLKWYGDLLQKLETQESKLAQEFSNQDIQKVKMTFTDFREKLEKNYMRGTLIYAKRREQAAPQK